MTQSEQYVRRTIDTALPILWMLFIYFGTAGMAGNDPAPCCGADRAIFETRHALTHLASFALQVWLICRALRLPGTPRVTRDVLIVIGVGLLIGVGQETLQSLGRHYVLVLDSLWDLFVDLCGSALGWWLYNLRALKGAPTTS